MTMLKELFKLDEKMWSGEVEANWKPPLGFFSKSASEIARGLKSNSDDYAQASRRLNFFINRAGKKLSDEDKSKLESAKRELRKQYGIKESQSLTEQRYNMDYNPVNKTTVDAIHSVARQHLSGVMDTEAVKALLSLSYARGFSAGRSEYENQIKKHLADVHSKESIKSAVEAAFAKGFSAGKSSWQK